MRMNLAPSLFLLFPLLVGLTGGCIDSGEVDGPRLADFKECVFHYPDAALVPCENQSKVLSVKATVPDGWACVDESLTSMPRHSFYRDQRPGLLGPELGDRFGYHFVTPNDPPAPVLHVLLVKPENLPARFYSFVVDGTRGFVEFPDPMADWVYYDLYAVSPLIDDANNSFPVDELRLEWSYWNDPSLGPGRGHFWAVLNLAASDGNEYHFNPMRGRSVGTATFYSPSRTYIQGADFVLDFMVRDQLNSGGGSPGTEMNWSRSRDCYDPNGPTRL